MGFGREGPRGNQGEHETHSLKHTFTINPPKMEPATFFCNNYSNRPNFVCVLPCLSFYYQEDRRLRTKCEGTPLQCCDKTSRMFICDKWDFTCFCNAASVFALQEFEFSDLWSVSETSGINKPEVNRVEGCVVTFSFAWIYCSSKRGVLDMNVMT